MVKQGDLFNFDLPPTVRRRPQFGALRTQIWSEQKAKLISRYLRLFVFITKHGTYIDGFSGPQYPEKQDAWTARLVLESEPRWLRSFFLCDIAPAKIRALQTMIASQPSNRQRRISLYEGDFNAHVADMLSSGHMREGVATFCLLDQHTFECEWRTVQALANAKKEEKIELMYFVPTGWFGRAAAAQQDKSVIERWWGRNDWDRLSKMQGWERALAFCDRFKSDFGYAFAHPWPIFEMEGSRGRVMYHLIHASDHPEAPHLMARAYRTATKSLPPEEQLQMEFDRFRQELQSRA
jgi:three-Cys-motif partner protein